MTSVDYYDLLGLPYDHDHTGADPSVLDCAGAAKKVWQRLDLATSPMDGAEQAEGGHGFMWAHLMREIVDNLHRLGDRYRDATRVGDIVVVGFDGFPNPRTMYTLVDLDPPTFLTSSPKKGVHTIERRVLERTDMKVLGVYRRDR